MPHPDDKSAIVVATVAGVMRRFTGVGTVVFAVFLIGSIMQSCH